MAESAAGDALFERTGKVSFVQVLPHALQHVLAAFAGIVTPAIIIASVCGFTPQEEAAVIQASLVLSALDIFLQQFPIKGVVGSGLPIVMGASFTFVPALKAVGLELGFEAVLGAQVIGGALVVLFGLLFKRVSFLFPAPVLGTVIFVIGLSLCPVAVASMAGGESAADFGSVTNWAVALVTFVVTFMAGNYGKGALKLGSILAGICAGFVLAAVLGMSISRPSRPPAGLLRRHLAPIVWCSIRQHVRGRRRRHRQRRAGYGRVCRRVLCCARYPRDR